MKIRPGLPLSLLVVLGAILPGCTSFPVVEPAQLTPLQIRAIETRSFESHDAKAVLKTVLNVLEDEGFLVDYGNADLGLLHATRTLNGSFTATFSPPIERFSVRANAIPNVLMLEATANVSEFGQQTKVRITFQRKISGTTGAVFSANPVTDPRIYQEFFAKLDRGLFIQKQGL